MFENHAEDWSTYSDLLDNCKYFEPNGVKCRISGELKVFSLNIRSLKEKIATLNDDIDNFSKFDVLCFNETNCSPDKLPFEGKELELKNFHPPIIQNPARASSRGGGLAIYLNKELCSVSDYKILTNLSQNSDPAKGEFLFVEIARKNNKNIIIGNMYRSPSGDPSTFICELESKLDNLKRHNKKHIILVSDSNLDLLKFQQYEPCTKYVNCLAEHGFAPTISLPTRVTSHSATLIDHIFVNNCEAVTKSGVITEDLSDHLAVFTNLLIDPNKLDHMISAQEGTFTPITDENLPSFKRDIDSVNWNFLNDIESADDKFTNFECKYREIYEKNFPPKKHRKNKRKCDKPWILPWLQSACDRKNRFYKEYVKNPSIENKTKYTKMKKFVAKHIKKAKLAYYDKYFKKYSDDGRKQWQMINQLLNRKSKAKSNITKLRYDDNTITNSDEIAQTFNNFFCNVAQRLKDENQSHPPGDGPPETTLKGSQRSRIVMQDADCSVFEIECHINSLKNKATSDLAIQPLKYVSKTIAPVLQHLISSSFLQGIFPTKLKRAKVIPLHKGGSPVELGNYRPISLLSCFSKVYEKIMHKRLTTFLDKNKIIFKSQYGFRAGHSCEHALLEAQYKLNMALDKKQIAALLLIDFSKAFDMVDHDILLNKLEHYGVRGQNLSWFRTYLTGRSQYVHVNGRNSGDMVLNYSVPQGSILGPLLFILYINDLPQVCNLAEYIFYADDANIIITADSYDNLKTKVDTVLRKINDWVSSNGLKLNIKKTKYMIFTNRHNINSDLDIYLNGVKIEHTNHERFLGVMIDTNLSWNLHMNILASKISRNAGLIYRLKGLVPESVLKTLYNSFIQSHLNYCSSIWGLGTKSSLNNIFTAQKKAVRAIENRFNIFFL